MKKRFAALVACVMLFTFLASVCVNVAAFNPVGAYSVRIGGETTNFTTIFRNGTHYVPLRDTFEKMGASIFYRARDYQVLALASNGDMIRHITGKNTLTVNGQQISFVNPSVVENGRTYIPLDMVLRVFYPEEFYCDNGLVIINKYPVKSDYLRLIKDVQDVCRTSDFRAENYQRYINYHVENPTYSMQDVIFNVNIGLDIPFYQNVTTVSNPHDLLVLVNKYYRLPTDFTQYNLVHMDKSLTINDGKEYLLEEGTYKKYMEMEAAARNAGLSMKVVSAYRTESYQNNLHTKRKNASGLAYADAYTARAGHSEHQTGLAVDINSTSTSFEKSREFTWLQEHAHEFGFIMRYPKGLEWITGYGYEPWHYRYVGVDAARIIHNEGITFEEFYVKYIDVNEFK